MLKYVEFVDKMGSLDMTLYGSMNERQLFQHEALWPAEYNLLRVLFLPKV